jgi:hypothetical protein
VPIVLVLNDAAFALQPRLGDERLVIEVLWESGRLKLAVSNCSPITNRLIGISRRNSCSISNSFWKIEHWSNFRGIDQISDNGYPFLEHCLRLLSLLWRVITHRIAELIGGSLDDWSSSPSCGYSLDSCLTTHGRSTSQIVEITVDK